MFEWLKQILGEAYTDEIDKKVAGEIGKAFVSKEDFNTANTAKKKLEEDIRARDKQLEELQKVDPQQLQAEIDRLKGENKAAQEAYQKDMKRLQKETAVKLHLNGKAHDPADILGLLDLEQIETDENGNLKTDLAEILKPIQEKKPYLFLSKEPPRITGTVPAAAGRREPGLNDNLELEKWMMEAGLPPRNNEGVK